MMDGLHLHVRDGLPYVIAEAGQNHNGSLVLAEELVRMAADPRPHGVRDPEELIPYHCNAVKFTARYLEEEGTRDFMDRDYTGPHSFGDTYRDHRRKLELRFDDYAHLSRLAESLDLDFGLTVCHPKLVAPALQLPHLQFLKVASRDLTNTPLLERLAELADVDIILSTGMATDAELLRALDILCDRRVAVLHCRSVYPTPARLWDLQVVPYLRARFASRNVAVGYSDHSVGILAPALAAALGAQVIEKHITLDRSLRGTDQAGSLERDGLWRMLRDIHAATLGVSGPNTVQPPEEVAPARDKLARSLAWAVSLPAGTVVGPAHLTMLSPGGGMPWEAHTAMVGRPTVRDVERHTICDLADVE